MPESPAQPSQQQTQTLNALGRSAQSKASEAEASAKAWEWKKKESEGKGWPRTQEGRAGRTRCKEIEDMHGLGQEMRSPEPG